MGISLSNKFKHVSQKSTCLEARRLKNQQMFAVYALSVGFKMKSLRKRVFLC